VSLHGTMGLVSTQLSHAGDPAPGTRVFSTASDPAMAGGAVHFVDRQRGGTALPAHVEMLATADQRLANILGTGSLWGFSVPWSEQVPVVSVSDLAAAELEGAFGAGLNRRGTLGPWAVVLDRSLLWQIGFRPVVYADALRLPAHRAALAAIYGLGWQALAVRTVLGSDDWTAEREWRYCFGPGIQPGVDIHYLVRAVIVGTPGWMPYELQHEPTVPPPARWLWDPASGRLVHDGRIALW
jgi:hypothetical protein